MNAATAADRSHETLPSRGFAALADPARLEIVCELERGPMCGCDLAPRLGMAPNLLSYHLRILREAGLVEGAKQGRRTAYRVRPKGLEELAVELVRLAVGTHEPNAEQAHGATPAPRAARSRDSEQAGSRSEVQRT